VLDRTRLRPLAAGARPLLLGTIGTGGGESEFAEQTNDIFPADAVARSHFLGRSFVMHGAGCFLRLTLRHAIFTMAGVAIQAGSLCDNGLGRQAAGTKTILGEGRLF